MERSKPADRRELARALRHAEPTGADLVVAKLDRLSRSVASISTIQDSEVRFVAADMPEATELTVHVMAAVAEAERKAIGTRTREALAADKDRGARLGNPSMKICIRKLCSACGRLERSTCHGKAFGSSKAKTEGNSWGHQVTIPSTQLVI